MTRKDNKRKGRVLYANESQKPDGRYRYRYTTPDGKTRDVYSWTLNPSDKTPAGKKPGKSLRELEDEINEKLKRGINVTANVTIQIMFNDYIDDKLHNRVGGKTDSTKQDYDYVLRTLEAEPLYYSKVIDMTRPEAKASMKDMLKCGVCCSYVYKSKYMLKSVFETAIENGIRNDNPFNFQLPKNTNRKKREALSSIQKKKFLGFIKNSSTYSWWYPVVVVLLGTGMRISEFLGLTIDDIDFRNGTIRVDHQLLCHYNKSGRFREKDGVNWKVTPPKTKAGIRTIPMNKEVREAIIELIERRKVNGEEVEIDGYSGFVYLNREGNPTRAVNVENSFRSMVNAYNRTHNDQLPAISPHILRHTFCTDMIYRGVTPKTLQYLMGHSTLSMTLEIYSHVSQEGALMEMKSIFNS